MYESLDIDSDDSIGSDILSNASFGDSCKNQPKLSPKLDENAAKELSNLLADWKFEYLYPILLEERIDLEALKNIRAEHFLQLNSIYKIGIGIAIKFEVQVNKWRNIPPTIESIDVELPNHDANKPNDVLSIMQIIRESPRGKLVMRHYDKYNTLNDTCRSTVLEIVNNHLIHKDIKMSSELAKQISLNIVKAFPTEELEMYYIKQPGKAIISKVLTKYYNTQRTLKKGGLIERRPYSNRETKPLTTLRNSSALKFIPEQNTVDYMTELQLNKCTFERLVEVWSKTKNYRVKDISQMAMESAASASEVLKKWPHYKNNLGFKLVDIDFKNMYPNAINLSIVLEQYYTKLLLVMHEKIKESNCREILKKLAEEKKLNARYTALCYLIHCLLPPVAKSSDNPSTSKKRCIRYSVRDSQNSMFMICETTDELDEKYKRKHSQITMTYPMVAILGTVEDPREFFVYFEDFRYKLNTVIEALDYCFKMYNLFNLKYPTASTLVWNFIQQFVYKIETEFDKHHPLISSLAKRLNEVEIK